MVPKDIADMTLKDLMSSKDVEIHKKDNVLRLKRRTPSETIMVEVRSYDDAAIISRREPAGQNRSVRWRQPSPSFGPKAKTI